MKLKLIFGLFLLIAQLANAADVLNINVKRNADQFFIFLPSNPTTGYQLKVSSYDKTAVELISSQYIAPKTNLIGGGGKMQFIFKLKRKQQNLASTKILFKYARPWESTKGSVKTVVVNFIE